ncbi:hypothetical protein ACIPT3_02250 [Streptomyces diastaticus]|uniref:hypothetical protein n=1 Tax=Streptomyces diastaticus TaxID=1956 RepID=UPI00381074A8
MFTIKYNGTTNHIDGLTVRTTGGGTDMGDHVSDYALNACPSLTRYRYAQGPEFADAEDALGAARTAGGRKLCKHCAKAAEAMVEAERARREERLSRDPHKEAFNKGRALGMDWGEALDYANAKTAELVEPTHVSSVVESASHDDDNEGGATMAANKLKLKDVRGDIRVGAVPGADAIHALHKVTDVHGRNMPLCPTRTKNPIQLWGPALDQKPELELCAACSKVVPTGDVTVTKEQVQVPGMNRTVTRTTITPVEGDDKGETMAEKPKTTDVDELISEVHVIIDQLKGLDPAGEGVTTEAAELKSEAEGKIRNLPTAKRTSLRKDVDAAHKAATQKPADAPASTEVATRTEPGDFNEINGVPELIEGGVKLFNEGLDLGLKLGNVGEKVAHTMLAIRTKITNTGTGLPDLMAERKTTKNAASAVYAKALESIADDDVARKDAHTSLVRATQNKASDVLVEWLRSFDGPDRSESLAIAGELFGDKLDGLKEDASVAEAIYGLYAAQGVELPRYGRTEMARYDRRVKAIESATKELEAERDGDADEKKIEELEEKIVDLKADVPADILEEKTAPKDEKSDAEKTAEALAAVKAQMEKAGKRFAKVKAANEKRKAKAELYAIIRSAADSFDLDLSALVTADED